MPDQRGRRGGASHVIHAQEHDQVVTAVVDALDRRLEDGDGMALGLIQSLVGDTARPDSLTVSAAVLTAR